MALCYTNVLYVLLKNFKQIDEYFKIKAPYSKEQTEYPNFGEISLQGGRNPEILKLWLSMLSVGRNGYGNLIRYSYEMTKKFHAQIIARDFLEIATIPETNIICFKGKDDAWTSNLQEFLLTNYNIFLSIPRYKRGGLWLRVVLLNPYFTEAHIKIVFDAIDKFYFSNKAR
jgi:glutamate/tyrosine decarboxylase-like PLP-dependent enzyme